MSHNSITSLPKAGVSLTSLDLSYNGMKRMPDKMGYSVIRNLDLSFNSLTTFESLPKSLSSLDISNNFIPAIPDVMLKSIPSYLNLDYNYLVCSKYSRYSGIYSECKQPNQYTCSSKTVSECDEFKNNYGICTPNGDRTKCFRYTKGLKDFCDFANDAGIENCESILQNETCTGDSKYHGFVYDCDKDYVSDYRPESMDDFLTEIPPSAGNLTGLYTIILSGLGLTSLPKSYANFKYAMYLDLSENKLSTLPAEIGSMEWLYYLNTSYNQLTSLPDSLGSISILKTLDVSHNKLSALPDVFDSLTGLSLDGFNYYFNSLSTIPESFKSLFTKTKYVSL